MKVSRYTFVLFTTVLATASAAACDLNTGERSQHVFLSWNGQTLQNWIAPAGDIHQVALPNGFHLGVELDEPPPDKYIELAEQFQHVPEIVEINLFELSEDEPELLSRTYGGTNSIQGFGARGGANRVEQLGDPGIKLTLLKPVCIEPSTVPVAR
ncbi:hypothetical protein G4Y73_12570 [Wenzhouxiangella sp. XN201]|uniref:hypothetical protein n=1 Tax=Wenzhouxiangella sp. XN201 TaxID=2710755 RepID=UPI0013C5F408|nr:hypothetical protein [Wenzhouxiangella sp. XN201]NEZ04984.1 hypothetical protein [Wenzhouxiangella sp. XN201]